MSSMADQFRPARAEADLVLCARRLRPDRSAGGAAGGAVPRFVRRGHPPAHVSHHRSARPRIVPAAGPDHSGFARLSASPAAGKAAGFCYLGAVFRHREGLAGGIPPGRHRILRPRTTRPRPMPRCSRSGLRRPRFTAWRRRKSASATSGCFPLSSPRSIWRRRGSGAWSRISTGNGRWRTISISSHWPARSGPPEYQGVLAALAGSDPKAAHHLVTDLLSIAGIAAVGGRSVAEIAERFLEQAALGAGTRLPREIRALIERFLAVRGEPDEAAGELRALAADARISLGARARSVRDTHRLSRRPRRRRARDPICHRVRPRLRLLHRLRVRAARSARQGPADRRRPLRRAADPARRARADPGGRLCRLDRGACGVRRRRMSAPLILAVPSKGRLQQNAEAFFRPLRARTRQAARRPRLSRRHRRLRRRRNRLPVGGGNHHAARRRAPCISASPARIWCAR